MRSVVITGTSTGIGWGAAKVLIANGFRVFGSVRKRADADRLKVEFGQSYVPLLFDVTDAGAVKEAAAEVRAALAGEALAGLVNNAGVAVAGPLLDLPVEEFRRQIEINLVGVVIVTQAFAPLLGTDRGLKGKPGRIVNISSVGGRIGNHSWHLRCLEVRARRSVGEPAARAAAVRHRRHRHRAGRGSDADLGQGRTGRCLAVSQHPLRRAAGPPAQLHADAGQAGLAAGADRRGGAPRAHRCKTQGPLHGDADASAELARDQSAQARGRSDGW